MNIYSGIGIFAALGGTAWGIYGLAKTYTEELWWERKRVYWLASGDPSPFYDVFWCKAGAPYCVRERLPGQCIERTFTGYADQTKWITPANNPHCRSISELYESDLIHPYLYPVYAILMVASLFALVVIIRNQQEQPQDQQN